MVLYCSVVRPRSISLIFEGTCSPAALITMEVFCPALISVSYNTSWFYARDSVSERVILREFGSECETAAFVCERRGGLQVAVVRSGKE